MSKIETINKFSALIDNGSVRLFTTTITEEESLRERSRLMRNNSAFYSNGNYIYEPYINGIIANLLRKHIREQEPGWCEVRTSPSRAFSTYWKNGNEITCLIKKKYERIVHPIPNSRVAPNGGN